MAKIFGSVDDRLRPLIRVRIPGRDDDALATVDTGFNGHVMMTEGDARQWGVEFRDEAEKVELGHGLQVGVQRGVLEMTWMEQPRRVVVLISER